MNRTRVTSRCGLATALAAALTLGLPTPAGEQNSDDAAIRARIDPLFPVGRRPSPRGPRTSALRVSEGTAQGDPMDRACRWSRLHPRRTRSCGISNRRTATRVARSRTRGAAEEAPEKHRDVGPNYCSLRHRAARRVQCGSPRATRRRRTRTRAFWCSSCSRHRFGSR